MTRGAEPYVLTSHGLIVRGLKDTRPILWRQNMNTFFIILFGLLQIADGIVTFFGLKTAEVDEVNPVLNYMAEVFGLGYSIALIKLAGLAFIVFLFVDRRKMKSRWITTSLGLAVSFYSWVVSSNVILVAGG